MFKKYFITGIMLASLMSSIPAYAATSTSAEDQFAAAEKKLQDRFDEAKKKLQDKIDAFKNKKVTQTAVIQCVAAAVGIRETAVGSAFTVYAGSQSAALSGRATALNAAWTASLTPSALRSAVNAAWKAYNNAHRAAVKAHNDATNAAWNSFRSSSKACKLNQVGGVPVESKGEGQDMAR